MNLKKYFIPLATAALLALTAAPALATNDINQGTTPPAYESEGTTNVTASVDTTYTVTIPDNDVLKFENLKATSPEADRTTTFAVSASNITLEPGKQINVTVKGSGDKAFQMTNASAADIKLPYSITQKDGSGSKALTPGGTIAIFENGATESVENTLTVNAPTMGAGSYADTLTFTCTVEGVNP